MEKQNKYFVILRTSQKRNHSVKMLSFSFVRICLRIYNLLILKSSEAINLIGSLSLKFFASKMPIDMLIALNSSLLILKNRSILSLKIINAFLETQPTR